MRCIDADALEKILEKIPAADIKNMGGQAYVLVKLSQVFNVIDNQPTIEPQRKGKWIDSHTTCSECGWQMIDDVIESPNIVAFNFCPNCGAEMTEGEG